MISAARIFWEVQGQWEKLDKELSVVTNQGEKA
jgi:hypothetical protein